MNRWISDCLLSRHVRITRFAAQNSVTSPPSNTQIPLLIYKQDALWSLMKDFSLSLHKQSLSTIRRRQWISEAIAFRVTQCLAFFYISLIKLKLFDEWIFNVPHSLAFLACFCDLTTVDKQRSRKLKFVQLFCPAGSVASLAKSTRCERPSRALSKPFINSIVFPKKKILRSAFFHETERRRERSSVARVSGGVHFLRKSCLFLCARCLLPQPMSKVKPI